MTLRIAAAVAAAIIISLPSTAMAASCYELWYSRNLLFDSKGYCFTTPLAQAAFDNSDCTTSSPEFTKKELAFIKKIQAEEKSRGCKVN